MSHSDHATLEIQFFEELLPHLLGKVFHVTMASSWPEIAAAGRLTVNITDRKSPFGNSANGYFRIKGCVSFFDYRQHCSPEWKEHFDKCLPTQPLSPTSPIVVLFLSESVHHRLLSWKGWMSEQLWSYRVVPHIECGHPGPVELTTIESVLFVCERERSSSYSPEGG